MAEPVVGHVAADRVRHPPAVSVIHIGLNELFNGANLQSILQTMRANYPTARIFYAGAFPVLSSNTPLQASARVTMNSTVATLSKSVIDGYFEFTSIYDPASGASEHAKAKYVSPDNLHYTPEGYQVMARDIDLT